MNEGVWCPDSLHIRLPSLKPLLPRIRFYKCETMQEFVHFLISLNLLRAPHQRKDSCVLIELRPVLFIELWQRFPCSSPLLYHPHCHSQSVGGSEGGAFFKEPLGDLVTCLPLTSITDAGQRCLSRPSTHLFEKRPLWCCYQAPLHWYGIWGLWSRLWKFHCFLWLQQIAPKCYKCKKD